MAEFHYFAALCILVSTAISLWRTLRGPTHADRIMGVLLVGTGGVAILALLFRIHGQEGVLDVALLLALLAAFAAIGFVKSLSPDGAGDPEEDG